MFFIINDTGTFKKILVNCSQKQFVANILIKFFLFYAIFRLAYFSSDPFELRPQKRDKEVPPSSQKVLLELFKPLVLKFAINSSRFRDIFMVWWAVLWKWTHTPTHQPPPNKSPNPLLNLRCVAPPLRSPYAHSINP